MRALHVIRARHIVPALLFGSTAIAGAQLANASAAATALSGAFTARATGYNAVAWNPANLAMPGNPGFSFTLLAVDGTASLKPIDLQKLHDYQGQFVPATVREQWLLDATAARWTEEAAEAAASPKSGLSLGSFAFQVNTKVASDMNLAPDAVEAILFGNAGRTGTVKTLNLAGSSLQGAAYSTGAVSYGLPLTSLVPLANFAVGATVKYTVGHAMVLGLDDGSAVNANDIKINFPAVLPDSNSRSKPATSDRAWVSTSAERGRFPDSGLASASRTSSTRSNGIRRSSPCGRRRSCSADTTFGQTTRSTSRTPRAGGASRQSRGDEVQAGVRRGHVVRLAAEDDRVRRRQAASR